MSEYYDPYMSEPSEPTDSSELSGSAEPADEPKQPRRRQQPAAPKRQQPRPQPKAKPKAKKAPSAAFLVFDARAKMFFGIVLLLFAAYCAIAAISALLHAGADQAALQYNSLGQIVSSGAEIANDAGPAGAKISQFMLVDTLGLGSLVVVYYMVMIGLKLLGWSKVRFWPLTLKCLVLAISISIVIGLVTYTFSGPIRFGGRHGYYVNDWLVSYASVLGAICVSIALTSLVIIIFMTQISRAIAAIKRASRQAASSAPAPAKPTEAYEPAAELEPAADPEPESEPEPAAEPDPSEPDEPVESSDPSASPELSPFEADPEPEPESEPERPSAPAEKPLEITANEIEQVDHVATEAYDPTADLSFFHFPPLELLEDRVGSKVTVDTEEQEANKQRIIDALAQFNIKIQSIKATVGPTITLFEVVPDTGQRIAAIKRVEEDLALALKAMGIRIIAPIPGRGTIGIEVPNNDPQVVSMRSIIASRKFQECKHELPMALGATISNEVFIADLAKMPHLLVAGATGQGKSVGLNAIITSLLYKKHPAELKFVLVDPKSVEFSLYRVLENHYLAKLPDEEEAVITEPGKVIATLNSLCVEMDQRYKLLQNAGCRTILEYNAKFTNRRLNPEKGHRFLPYIVLIIDEFADLIMTAGKEIETPICRIAQKARAVGIHAIIATQRPSVNVLTGLIKAQFPGRIAFRVAQTQDSKTILDCPGAHQLIGRGDMFFSTNGNMTRVQCAFIDTPEVESICDYISEQQGYPSAYELPEYVPDLGGDGGGAALGGQPGSPFDRDPLFEEAARFLVGAGNTASTSSLQRRYNIGYNRAGRLMDQLESAGIVGQAVGSKPRQVLVDIMTLDSMFS